MWQGPRHGHGGAVRDDEAGRERERPLLSFETYAKQGTGQAPPVLAFQLPAARFTPGAISCAEATDLVLVGIPAVGERLSSLGPKAAAGARPKRACTVTFVQAIEWGAWASSWTAHQATAYSSLAPSGTTRLPSPAADPG